MPAAARGRAGRAEPRHLRRLFSQQPPGGGAGTGLCSPRGSLPSPPCPRGRLCARSLVRGHPAPAGPGRGRRGLPLPLAPPPRGRPGGGGRGPRPTVAPESAGPRALAAPVAPGRRALGGLASPRLPAAFGKASVAVRAPAGGDASPGHGPSGVEVCGLSLPAGGSAAAGESSAGAGTCLRLPPGPAEPGLAVRLAEDADRTARRSAVLQ